MTPTRERIAKRAYTTGERAAVEEGAAFLGLSFGEAFAALGEATYDVYLNDRARWANVPEGVWGYFVGGYAAIKKWLSYREEPVLGRPSPATGPARSATPPAVSPCSGSSNPSSTPTTTPRGDSASRTAPARAVPVSRPFLLALALLCAVVLLAGCGDARIFPEGSSAPGEEFRVTVSRVVDGDTVGVTPAVGGNDTVRLIGVDTPERGEPLYDEAAVFTGETLEGERVTLELDAEEEDGYGRLLAYVYRSDGSMFNEALVREGYAQVATFPPNTRYLDRFEAAQEEARRAERGVWGLPAGEACELRDRGNGIGGGCGG